MSRSNAGIVTLASRETIIHIVNYFHKLDTAKTSKNKLIPAPKILQILITLIPKLNIIIYIHVGRQSSDNL